MYPHPFRIAHATIKQEHATSQRGGDGDAAADDHPAPGEPVAGRRFNLLIVAPDGFVFALRLFHVAKRGPHRVGWAARIPFRSPSRKSASHQYRDTAAESPFAAGKKIDRRKKEKIGPGSLIKQGRQAPG
jgi:hypothetical protein